MSNKKTIMFIAFLIVAAAVGLTAIIPEQEYLHVPFQLMAIAIILLSVHMHMKDVIILLMISSAVVWGMGYYEVIKQMQQLVLETGVLLAICMILGLYETGYKEEKHKLNVVWNYKKKEAENLRNEIQILTQENHTTTEAIKEVKKYFAQ